MRLTRNPRADGGRRCGQFSAAPSEHLAACPQAGGPDAITQAAPVGSDVREIAAAPHVYGEPPRDAQPSSACIARCVRTSTRPSGNSADGVVATSSTTAGALIFVTESVSSNNGTNGIRSEGGNSAVRMTEVTTTGNATGLASTFGGSIVSFGNNYNSGNGSDGAPTLTINPQ